MSNWIYVCNKDDIDFEDMLWKLGIKLPNENDPDNQYPEEDQ